MMLKFVGINLCGSYRWVVNENVQPTRGSEVKCVFNVAADDPRDTLVPDKRDVLSDMTGRDRSARSDKAQA